MRTPVVLHSIALASAEPTPVRSGQAIEYRKAPFLILVKALVQRICGVGQFLQGRTRIRHGCGALTQALDRVVTPRPAAQRRQAVHPQLAVVARRLLEGRPVLLLIRGQQQARLERREPRFTECAQVLGVGLKALHHHAVASGTLLRIDERRSGNGERSCSRDDGFPHDTCPPSHPASPRYSTLDDRSTNPREPRIKL